MERTSSACDDISGVVVGPTTHFSCCLIASGRDGDRYTVVPGVVQHDAPQTNCIDRRVK